MPRAEPALSLRHALALGLLQGPAELLPVSSSAHISLVARLAGWPYAELDPDARKSFELALHAGTAAALGLAMGGELRRAAGALPRPRLALLMGLASAPPALAGLLLRRWVESRLDGPRTLGAGLLAGAAAMALADRRAPEGRRACVTAGAGDGLALGLAQVAALAPGVSRSGATMAAARARGHGRSAARLLCWGTAMPLLAGAGAFEGQRLVRGRAPAPAGPAALGGGAAFASTLLAARALRDGPGPLAPYAAYRACLAAAVLLRPRRAK